MKYATIAPPKTSIRGTILLAGLFAMACIVISCLKSDGPALVVTHDLVDRFAQAQAQQPSRLIDFSSAAVRPLLVRGWHHDAAQAERSTRQVRRIAELAFHLGEPEDTAVEIRCAPLDPVSDEVVLELSINEKPWAQLSLDRELRTYDLKLGADLLQWGENRLRIDLRSPRPTTRIDWRSIRFDGPIAEHPARIQVDQDLLFIPFGTWVDYFLEIPAEAQLDIRDVQLRGAGKLDIAWTADGQPRRLLASDTGPIQVTGGSPETGQLSFFAIGDATGPTDAQGVALFEPRIVSATTPETVARAGSQENAPKENVRQKNVPPNPRPNVVIYMIDTLRADHLGCYGYGKDTSPNIDRFAAENFLFLNSQANSPWTRPSVASLLTSLLPQTHGVNKKKDRLTDKVLTLQEILRDTGYNTAAVVANGNVAGPMGFSQGFEHFNYLSKTPTRLLATSQDVNQAAFDWLDQQGSQDPFFLYLHTIDPHAPYDPPEAERLKFAPNVDVEKVGSLGFFSIIRKNKDLIPEYIEQVQALYDGEIAANDASFGLLLNDLKARGIYNNTLIVVLSDHGEEFFDHGDWVHGKTLHAEMLNTPLIIKMPADFAAPRRIEQLAQHVDVMPTILDYLKVAARPQVVQGRSLLPLMRGEDTAWLDRSFAFLDLNSQATSIIDGEWKMIQFWDEESEGFPKLYRRSEDMQEHHDLAAQRSVLARYLVSIRRLEDEASISLDLESAVETDALDQEDIRKNLEALGYLDIP